MVLFLAGLLLAGCGSKGYENPYRVDTVIQIPADPTQVPTETPEEMVYSTEAATEPEKTAETQAFSEKSTSSSSKTTTGSKKATTSKSSTSSGTKTTAATESKAAETQPTEPETTPPETEVPETEVPETEAPTEAPTEPACDPAGYTVGSLEYAVLEQINIYRAEAGVPELAMDEGLCAVASVRAFEISALWSHTRPDGRDYKTVLTDYGYGYGAAAENLVYVTGGADAAAIVAKWMSADSNRSSLLSESFTVAGVGIYSSSGVTYLANLLIG